MVPSLQSTSSSVLTVMMDVMKDAGLSRKSGVGKSMDLAKLGINILLDRRAQRTFHRACGLNGA